MKSLMVTCLIVCSLLFTPSISAEESNNLSLDATSLKRCLTRLRRGPNGLLVFRFFDSDTQTLIDSVDILIKLGGGNYRRPVGEWKAVWVPPNYYHFKFVLSGYMSIAIDSILVVNDSATIVTVNMIKGDGAIKPHESGDSRVHVAIVSLDGTFPKNEILGRVIDDSSGLTISGATVYCEETNQTVISDSAGQFVVSLNLLSVVTINAWHPLYDSIRFEVSKYFVRTPKEIEIHFQTQRRTVKGETIKNRGDSTVILLVDMMDWASLGRHPLENLNRIYTYSVLPGELFGATSHWLGRDCLPFRLIKYLPDKVAWIQFSQEFRLVAESYTNFAFLYDSAVTIMTNTVDAGTTVSLSIQPVYTPLSLMQKRDYGHTKLPQE